MTVGQPERRTQERVIHEIFVEKLGYTYGGNLTDKDTRNVDEDELRAYLLGRGHDPEVVRRAIQQFLDATSLAAGASLYDANKAVYKLLRYGVRVKRDVSENFETVWLIDWTDPDKNDFVVAEEVSIKGAHNKRPDVVLYVNGIALGIAEFKRSSIFVSEGVRQNIGNQGEHFIRPFFTTNQLMFAGNDVEGMRYGVIGAKEKYWLHWKEPEDSTLGADVEQPLDKAFVQMCSKDRFLELIHDFIAFDLGFKKTARHNQYFGVKKAQDRVRSREGGIIWHTQGSGKSLTMVWLAKWIREHQDDARVLIVTDRAELDKQISDNFNGVNEAIYRTKSGDDLVTQLNNNQPWLICSLVHKFRGEHSGGENGDTGGDAFIAELNSELPASFSAKGNLFVFVDEAHRTQSGKLHVAMKALMPGAMFIGFTGTPLLKADKASSIGKFGSFIHTYKFDEAVRDGVVLDLRYEARRIDPALTAPDKVDKWFEAKTKGMTDLTKAQLRKRWGTMQRVVSAEPRTKQIVQDILLDMEIKPRLMDGTGNAMLVCDNVYQACKFFEMFQASDLNGKVAIVTSFVPNPTTISKEDAGEGDSEELIKYNVYRLMLADHFGVPADEAVKRIGEFEDNVKDKFVNEPGQMRLLIVVDKLLTGFDAPSATYVYIDKKMRDHGLFQAICRVNRLDGEEKTYGYVVDYRDLFKALGQTITNYTSGAFDGYSEEDVDGLLKNNIAQAREDLDEALEGIRALCEAVEPPKGTLQYQHYFCAKEPGDSDQLKANEPRRVDLYKAVNRLVRTYAILANDTDEAGYIPDKATAIAKEVTHYVAVRDEVRLGAGENVDLKQFEPGMRRLLDTYVQADPSETIADFDEGLVELLVEQGLAALDGLPKGIRGNPQAAAETIVNNVRKTIVDARAMNPKYYDSMSTLLDAIIDQLKQENADYEALMQQVVDLASKIVKGESTTPYPNWADTAGKRALVDFAWPADVDQQEIYVVIQHGKDHGWTESRIKERALRQTITGALPSGTDPELVGQLVALLKEHHEFR